MGSPVNKKYLVSACLAGINCTFRQTNNLNIKVKELVEKKEALVLCPEVFAGLGVPRENVEIVGGDGLDALKGHARVLTTSGKDVTRELIAGSEKILELVKKYKIKEAILKSNSPMCGSNFIYDGTFSKTLREGDGILAALLKEEGLRVFTEKEV